MNPRIDEEPRRYRDADGDIWEVPEDLLRSTDTGRVMTRDEVADFFGPLTPDN